MSEFIIDVDPIIPTGVPATPVEVGELILSDVLPAAKVTDLVEYQQPTPEDLGSACVASEIPTDEAKTILEDAGLEVIIPEPPAE